MCKFNRLLSISVMMMCLGGRGDKEGGNGEPDFPKMMFFGNSFSGNRRQEVRVCQLSIHVTGVCQSATFKRDFVSEIEGIRAFLKTLRRHKI